MQFSHGFEVDQTPAQVWMFTSDVPSLLDCIPGVKSVACLGQELYQAVISERVGPFKVEFHIDAEVSCPEPGRLLKAVGGGKDAVLGSTVQIKIAVSLSEMPSGATHVDVNAELTVFGKLATLGFGVMQHKARENMNGFAANMKRHLEEGLA